MKTAPLLLFLPAVPVFAHAGPNSKPIQLEPKNPNYSGYAGKTISLVTGGKP